MFNENTWREGEKKAQQYMLRAGYKIVYTNFQCVGTELDIVAILPVKVQLKNLKQELKEKLKKEKAKRLKILHKQIYKNLKDKLADLLIITEVKARSTDKYGIGAEAVDSTKMYHMKKGADYLLQKEKFAGMQVRFDVASVDAGEITYLEGAFWQI